MYLAKLCYLFFFIPQRLGFPPYLTLLLLLVSFRIFYRILDAADLLSLSVKTIRKLHDISDSEELTVLRHTISYVHMYAILPIQLLN